MKKMRILMSSALLLTCGAAGLWADPVSGTLFLTTFDHGVNGLGTNLDKVTFNFNGTSISYTGLTGLALLPGADGLLFAPNASGNLLVGGQGTPTDGAANEVLERTVNGAAVSTAAAGQGAYNIALNSAGTMLFSSNNGGCGTQCITGFTLSGGNLSGAGVLYTVSNSLAVDTNLDVRGLTFDPLNNTWYYGSAGDTGTGDFGTVAFNNGTHTAVLTPILQGVPAHSVAFDSFTGDIFFNGSQTIAQYHPGTNTVVSTFTGGAGDRIDQVATDGAGHLIGSSNNGDVIFIDYDASHLINGGGNFHNEQFLINNLDDVAPLVNPNATPEPASIFLFGSVLVGIAFKLRKRNA